MARHYRDAHQNQKEYAECSECKLRLLRHNLDRHMLTHTEAVAAHCDICDKDYKTAGNYRLHCQQFAYEHDCIESGNCEFGVWPAATSFQHLYFQFTAARSTSEFRAPVTVDARSNFTTSFANSSRCKRQSTRRSTCSLRWRRRRARHSATRSRRSSRLYSMSVRQKFT